MSQAGRPPTLEHVAEEGLRPDLVLLQEASTRVWSRRALSRLAAAGGLRLLGGGRAAAGNVALGSDRLSVRAVRAVRFRPVNPWIQRRGAVLVTLGPEHGSGPAVRVAGTHLSLRPDERGRHVRELLSHLRAGAGPGTGYVVAGDLNEPPGGAAWQALADLVRDPAPEADATFPARTPRRRIDAVLTSPEVRTLDYRVWTPRDADVTRASDHLPVLSLLGPAD